MFLGVVKLYKETINLPLSIKFSHDVSEPDVVTQERSKYRYFSTAEDSDAV